MRFLIFDAFVKEALAIQAQQLPSTPPDYLATKVAARHLFGIEKRAFDWHGFKEGIVDEGIPLGGATIGAAIGGPRGAGLRGAALGYAAGGGLSLLRSKLRGEEPSMSRKLLAAGALGYGAGGLAHGVLEHATHNPAAGLGRLQGLRNAFHGPNTSVTKHLVEEALPATGATLGTGLAMGMTKKDRPA